MFWQPAPCSARRRLRLWPCQFVHVFQLIDCMSRQTYSRWKVLKALPPLIFLLLLLALRLLLNGGPQAGWWPKNPNMGILDIVFTTFGRPPATSASHLCCTFLSVVKSCGGAPIHSSRSQSWCFCRRYADKTFDLALLHVQAVPSICLVCSFPLVTQDNIYIYTYTYICIFV